MTSGKTKKKRGCIMSCVNILLWLVFIVAAVFFIKVSLIRYH
jgi:hypothetical protein